MQAQPASPKPTAPEETSTTCRPSFINSAIERTIGSTRSAHSSPSAAVTVLVPTLITSRRADFSRFSRSESTLDSLSAQIPRAKPSQPAGYP